MGLPENKLRTRDRIQGHDKAMWKVDGNHSIKEFTEDEIERITSNYSTLIGKGGFGEVFRGVLDDDHHNLVAVKRYIRGDLIEEFMEEVNIHSQINHKNALKLVGCCIGENTLTMVTEYISKGNLDDTLHNSDISIPLDIRLGIAIGCAEALDYMHSMHLSIDSLVCHGDIKPANILLDGNLTAKVSDFGLSRLLWGGITRYTSSVKGSIDYMDPLYLREGRLTWKSDVYSFGAVLLELIARKRVKQGNTTLIGTFSKACAKGKELRGLFDAEITNDGNLKILEEIGKLATDCLTLDIDKRPAMNEVAKRLVMLWRALRGGEGNIGWRFFWKKQSESEGGNGQGTSSVSSTSTMLRLLRISKRTAGNSEVLNKLGNMRIFTKGELDEVTQNYACLLGWIADVYTGTLEDNTLVVVEKYSWVDAVHKDMIVNAATILSQIVHKNIIKLFGCCLEDDIPILVYEYASKGNLSDILHSYEVFPLELRLNIAVKTAEALWHLHSSAAGVIQHGDVDNLYNILVDDNFMPKLSGFLFSMKLTKDPGEIALRGTDVVSFGIILLKLISRKQTLDLVAGFIKAYERDDSGKEMFDKEITAHEDITVCDKIGRLALKCTSPRLQERPTMEEVAQVLEMLRSSWKKKRMAKEA